MIKRTRFVLSALVLTAVSLLVVVGLRLTDGLDLSSSEAPPSAVEPSQIDPAMTTEAVPQYRDDGVVPTPSDAVGEWKPISGDESSKK